jgi:hypothetical protein
VPNPPTTPAPGPDLTSPGLGGSLPTSPPAGGTAAPATRALTVSARVTGRAEDGLTVRYDASEPVTATIRWGAAAALDQSMLAGSGRIGSVRLTFSTTEEVSAQVEVRTADGRRATSNLVGGRRLVRHVVLDVTRVALRFPARDRAGLVTSFLGTSLTPIRFGAAGPGASARPYRFPGRVVTPETTSATFDLRVTHHPAGGIDQTGTATVLLPLPGRGSQTVAYTQEISGVQVTLDLRVTAVLR